LLSLFQTRYKLFKEVYLHRKSIAIDLMVKDALILSNSHFNFLEAIYNPEEYVKLDDGILNTILNFNEYDEDTNHPNLLKASKLVDDISKRKIYRYVGEIIIPKGFEYFINMIKLDDITSCNNPEDEYFIRPDDLDLVFQSFDYGNSDRNPFDSIYFYKYEYPNQSFLSQMKNKSLGLPIVFKESMIFLYCKDINKYERAVEIFDSYASKLKKEIELIKYKKEEKKLYSTPRKNNNDKDKFISNKRGSECCIDDLIKERKNLNFNKIN
jgi:HD superfamily phosphohydrolase